MTGRWLAVVGIGEDGVAGLGATARNRVEAARHVFGGQRHLDHVAGLGDGARHLWTSPLTDSLAAISALRGEPVCVLASGDPFHFGIGATLARTIAADEMEVFPAASSFSLAAAALGWALQDVACLSLVGRPLATLRPHLHPRRKLLVLTPDSDGPAQVAAFLARHGFGAAQMTVLEALGGTNARVRETRADAFGLVDVGALNIVAIALGEAAGLVIPFTSGLPDDAFAHDGQITKAEIRALTLSALAPAYGAHLWDIGAGSGSVSIEWMLAHPSLSATAIERDPVRAARIRDNAEALGVPGLALVTGHAPVALDGLAPPDAIFVGGGGSDPGVLDAAIAALKPGGRLVANAVTLAMEALLLVEHARRGGTLRRIALSRAAAVGTMTGWRPALPVTQWVWHKDVS